MSPLNPPPKRFAPPSKRGTHFLCLPPRNLRRLDVSGVAVPSPGLVRILLEEMLPRCQVLGMEVDGGPPPSEGSPP